MAYSFTEFLDSISKAKISNDESYREGQLGTIIDIYEDEFPDIVKADIILLGCTDQRGAGLPRPSDSALEIRKEFYKLYYWHTDLNIADIGNVKTGKTITDTYAALKVILRELIQERKKVIILGGSHDLTLAQYDAFVAENQLINAVGIDAIIDINLDAPFKSDNFLMDLLTAEPNYLQHYNHIGFQSYFIHPKMLETMDKLRFDCYRVGKVKEHIEEMEPVIRNCHMLTFDISALANAFAPANRISPNGLNGEEACILMQYAGMSNTLKTIGIYGYRSENDVQNLTSKQISHMLWYYLDGNSRGNREAQINERESFNEYHTAFSELETTFLQSKKTGRWWMQLPDKQFIACSYKDYLLASSNEIPERWLRAQERP
ncbi:MAG TPA: formimidoylglutamase [Flavisolibacter sp.]|nr:formimidoylglutamase [Flavisolibacter sp.]